MFIAGISATLETDFKKIVAFSTLSQIGILFFMLSVRQLKILFLFYNWTRNISTGRKNFQPEKNKNIYFIIITTLLIHIKPNFLRVTSKSLLLSLRFLGQIPFMCLEIIVAIVQAFVFTQRKNYYINSCTRVPKF